MRHDAACHCGTVRFTVELPDGIASARRCDCSFCAMRGAVAVSATLDGITFTAGEGNLSCYTFNTGTAQHFFCKNCGIYTHHRRRSNPNEYGVNLACISGQTPFLPVVNVVDGQAHPSDGAPPRIAGTLSYSRIEAET
tara:strand:+ start:4643 stop:5056 length:414 start_codon:yes stop_codon:yes gene_type:complete